MTKPGKHRRRTIIFRGVEYSSGIQFAAEMLPGLSQSCSSTRISAISRTRAEDPVVITEEEYAWMARRPITPSQAGRLGRLASEKTSAPWRLKW